MRQFGMIKNKNSNESEAIQLCWNSEYLPRLRNTKTGSLLNSGVIKAAAERDIAERKEMVLKEPRADEIKLEAFV